MEYYRLRFRPLQTRSLYLGLAQCAANGRRLARPPVCFLYPTLSTCSSTDRLRDMGCKRNLCGSSSLLKTLERRTATCASPITRNNGLAGVLVTLNAGVGSASATFSEVRRAPSVPRSSGSIAVRYRELGNLNAAASTLPVTSVSPVMASSFGTTTISPATQRC